MKAVRLVGLLLAATLAAAGPAAAHSPVTTESDAAAHDTVVEITTVQGDSFTSFNDDGTAGGANTVDLTRTTIGTSGHSAFRYRFPAASVTVLTLRPHLIIHVRG